MFYFQDRVDEDRLIFNCGDLKNRHHLLNPTSLGSGQTVLHCAH